MTRLLFVTGTRADFGKLKPLIRAAQNVPSMDITLFTTGMHMQEKYGLTVREVESLGCDVYPFVNFSENDSMGRIVAKTLSGLMDYMSAFPADFLVVHGDRPEALAAATAGALSNTRVIHVEGGELSGTVDESLRHAITKLSHVHLVSNQNAAELVLRLGENPNSVHVIGSPELDTMTSPDLPTLGQLRERYGLSDLPHIILIFHPVTTQDPDILVEATKTAAEQLSKLNEIQTVAILPNNDLGSSGIAKVLSQFSRCHEFRVFPSMRFEYYLTLLKTAEAIVGNSSSGVREAPFFGTPTINVGSRQNRRGVATTILNVDESQMSELHSLIHKARSMRGTKDMSFGDGKTGERFGSLLTKGAFDLTPIQKSICLP